MSAASGAVSHRRLTEPAALRDAVPGLSMLATPPRHEAFQVDLTTITLDDMVLAHGRTGPLVLVVSAKTALLALPTAGGRSDTLLVNGQRLPPFGFGLVGPGVDVVLSNTQADTYVLLVMHFAAAELRVFGEADHALLEPGRHGVRVATPTDWDRMAKLVGSAVDIAREGQDVFATAPPRRAFRSALLGVAQDLVAGGKEPLAARRERTIEGWRRIVLGAGAHLDANLDRPIYTEDLCRALAVSPAVLAEAFQVTLGTSPHRHLKLRRLNMVRAALMRRDGPPPLVKSVALSHGFWHLGQFARDYRDQFGEMPSETLGNATGTPGREAESGEEPAPPRERTSARGPG